MMSLLTSYSVSALYKSEIIVSTTYNIWDADSAASIVNRAKANNIEIISLLFKQDEDEDEEPDIPQRKSGATHYPSSVVPEVVLPEFATDFLTDLIKLAHQNGIKVKAWVPQFHDQVALNSHQDWSMIAIDKSKNTYQFKGTNPDHAEYFVNPINVEVQNYEISILEEIVTKFDVDMVVLDWVRFDSYNMDLSDYSITKWMEYDQQKRDPKQFDFDPTDNSDWETVGQWNEWRTDVMGAYVTEASKRMKAIRPNVKVGAYVLSPFWEECGQDIAKFKDAVDFVAPMCYFNDFGEGVDWVYKDDGIVDLCVKKVGSDSKVVPVFSFPNEVIEGVTDDDTWKKILENLGKKFPNIDTISFFYWTYWQDEMFARADAVRSLVSLPDKDESSVDDLQSSSDDESSADDESSLDKESNDSNSEADDSKPEINDSNHEGSNSGNGEGGGSTNINENSKVITIAISVSVAAVVVIVVVVVVVVVMKKRRSDNWDNKIDP